MDVSRELYCQGIKIFRIPLACFYMQPLRCICTWLMSSPLILSECSFFFGVAFKCALRESGCRICYESRKMSYDLFWQLISRNTNMELADLSLNVSMQSPQKCLM